jgi:hypothetical protein
VPFLANIQAAALYPPNLLLLLMPVESAIGWLLALHLGLAGAGMYLYALRGPRLRTAGSAVAGIVYMLSAFMIAHAGHLNQTNTLAWTPWLMLAADRCALGVTARRLAAIGALVALVILAGHTQQAYFSFLLAAIAAATRWVRLVRAGRLREVAARLVAMAAAVTLGAGLAAVQLAATFELVGQSVRSGGLPLDEAGVFGLPFKGLAGDLLPNYLVEHSNEFAGSVGIVALLLAALAVLRDRRKARSLGWLALAAVALLVAFGTRLPVYLVFFHLLPGFDLFRVPARALLFVVVAAAILAGRGTRTLEQLAAAWRRGHRRSALQPVAVAAALVAVPLLAELAVAVRGGSDHGWLAIFPNPVSALNVAVAGGLLAAGVAAAGLAIRWRRAVLLVPVLVATDLLLLAAPTYPLHPLPATLYQLSGALEPQVPASLDQRYLSLLPDDAGTSSPPPPGLTPVDERRWAIYASLIEAMFPDYRMVRRPLDADGYDGGLLPIRSYVQLRRELIPANSANPPDFTDHLLADHVEHRAFLEDAAIGTVLSPAGTDPNPADCPECLAPAAPGVWMNTGASARAHLEDGTRARVVEDSGERLVVELPPQAAGRLVLADTWYPGWTATAGGRELPVLRYRGALRAVELPSGSSRVVFEYRPRWLVPALLVTALSVLITVALALAPWLPTRRAGAAARLPSGA